MENSNIRQPKKFLTYEEQIELLKVKKLTINDDEYAINCLKKYSYYSLVSGYKDIFKVEKNGNYRSDACFEYIVNLYIFDEYLRNLFLHKLINIEKTIKSLYSYSFCETYGDNQTDYLNATNYNYNTTYQNQVNEFISKVNDLLSNSYKYPYIDYNVKNYGSAPFWVLIHALTFGTISKVFSFSQSTLQSKVSREFDNIYSKQLSSMLSVLSKFRNVCAHGERLYNYKTKKSLTDLPIHKEIKGYYNNSKNDLFNVCICFKYLLPNKEFQDFIEVLSNFMKTLFKTLDEDYKIKILKEMGFPENWEEILSTK